MERSLRFLLTSQGKPTEQSLLNVYNKLISQPRDVFSSDLFILLAEKFFELPKPLQKHIIDKAESMVQSFNRLQEPHNQFHIRAMIVQAQVFSCRATQLRGNEATELNLKAIDYISRALKSIQSTSLYQPLGLNAAFAFYQIAHPFFPAEDRHHLQQVVPVALQMLETHLSGKFDSTLRLFIALTLLNGCILDDAQRFDEASKQVTKLFGLIPQDQVMLRFSLLHILTHFNRKSPGGLMKMKFDMNDQLQKAVILYQGARSNNTTQTKDLAEVYKICTTYLDSKKDTTEENNAFETLLGEVGRIAAQFGQTNIANDCYQRASNARFALGRLHAILINAELGFANNPEPEERADIIGTCSNCMSLAQGYGDLVLVQDAAALLWTHAIQILNRPGLIKRHLLSAVDILARVGSHMNLMRAEIHFTLGKIFEIEKDSVRALEQLKKAISLDYLVNDHPSKLQHPFDRFLDPFYKMLSVSNDPLGQHVEPLDQAYALIIQSKSAKLSSLQASLDILNGISSDDVVKFDAIQASHFASIWSELIKAATNGNQHQFALDSSNKFLNFEFDIVQYETVVEIQCETCIHAIISSISCNILPDAIKFLQFALTKGKQLKIPRLQFNAISTIWNSYFSSQDPKKCGDYIDILNECINALFEIDFEPVKLIIGQFSNFIIQALLESCSETSQAPPTAAAQKKKPQSLDPTKQKQLRDAEVIAMKSVVSLTSIYEKKVMVDRIVEIFARKNSLPPAQSDQETSILIRLATIMNEKVQHKSEELTSIFSSLQNLNSPVLYAILSERANKLELGQLTTDSAQKFIELMPNPTTSDEYFYSGLAYFNWGSTCLRLIQPELQEFSCQDKLRFDASNYFLRAADCFSSSKNIDNSKLSLSLFCSTVSVAENYPKFRAFISDILLEALQLSKKISINDDLRVCLYRIYLRVLIDHKDWSQCRRIIHDAITSLDKNVHSQIWELNLVVTANADCDKSEAPLIDEMLRVKQLGDSKYQSHLWTFVADLATDPEIQQTALTRAYEVLSPECVSEKFQTSINHAKWHRYHSNKWEIIEKHLKNASNAISNEQNNVLQLQKEFEIEFFRLKYTKYVATFDNAINSILKILSGIWTLIAELNQNTGDDEPVDKKKSSSRANVKTKGDHKQNIQTPKEEPLGDFKVRPSSINGWQELMKQIDKHKFPAFEKSEKFASELLETIEITQFTGREYELLLIWYILMGASRYQIQNARFEQIIYMKFTIFLDRLNTISQIPYNNDFSITDQERNEWEQKVGRYLEDPPSDLLPLRSILIQQCWVLLELGEYRSAIVLAENALTQSEQLNDNSSLTQAKIILAIIQARSGCTQKSISYLQIGTPGEGLPFDIWIKWFSAAFLSHEEENISAFVFAMCEKFCHSCVNDDMTIAETIELFGFYIFAIKFLNNEDTQILYFQIKGSIIMPDSFMPSIDLRIAFMKKFLTDPEFPPNIVDFQLFGKELLKFIDSISQKYSQMIELGTEASVPVLIRYVDVVNIFGEYVISYRPKIEYMTRHGLDYSIIGKDDTILNEFVDNKAEPFEFLSPSAAVLHFNSVQNLENIPLPQLMRLNVIIGQCLFHISQDIVTKQNAVKFLWKSIPQLIEREDFHTAGNISKILVDTLVQSDLQGAIQMFVTAQNAIAYKARLNYLFNETPPENRESLFVKENLRIVERFMKPQISSMFQTVQHYFKEIPSETSFLRHPYNPESLKKLCTTHKMLIFVVDVTLCDNSLAGTLISFNDKESIISERLNIDLDSAAMKIEIFRQIIAPPKKAKQESQAVEEVEEKKKTETVSTNKKGKKEKNDVPVKQIVVNSNQDEFGIIASKAGNPEFDAFIKELAESLEPITKHIVPEYESIMFISSLQSFHTIPFSAIPVFNKFTKMYHDFSIISATLRNPLLTTIDYK